MTTIIIVIAFKISMTELRSRVSNIDMAKPQKMCVAYLDILGYSNFIKECDPTAAFMRIKKAFRGSIIETLGYDFKGIDMERGVKIYSDNIIVYTQLYEDGKDSIRCAELLLECALNQNDFIMDYGFQLRGGIAIGECYVDEFVFGKGFDEAHYLESKVADWARVMVSEEVIQVTDELKDIGLFYFMNEGKEHYLDFLRTTWHNYQGNDKFSKEIMLRKLYQKYLEIYNDSLDHPAIRLFTFKEYREVSKIINKNNRMLKYITDYCIESGLENIERITTIDNPFYIKMKDFEKLFDKMTVDDIGKVETSLRELIESYLDYYNTYKLMDQSRNDCIRRIM